MSAAGEESQGGGPAGAQPQGGEPAGAQPQGGEPAGEQPDEGGRPPAGGQPDVLLLSLGTTLGWRAADAIFVEQLRAAGATVAAATVRMGATARLRRAYPVTDLVEALAARRALRAAVRWHRPRALVISSTTAAMLADPEGLPYAVRLDAPARLNRPGVRNVGLHALERRALSRARLVLPWSRAALPARSSSPRPSPPPAIKAPSASASPSPTRPT